MSEVNKDKLNDLFSQVSDQYPNLHAFVCALRKRFEGILEVEAQITSHPDYLNLVFQLKEQGHQHPMLDRLLEQHNTLSQIRDFMVPDLEIPKKTQFTKR